MLSHFSHVLLFVTLWTVARQSPLSVEPSRQEYWSGLPCPPLGDLPNPGIKLVSSVSPALQVDSWPSEPPGKPHALVLIKSKLHEKKHLFWWIQSKVLIFETYFNTHFKFTFFPQCVVYRCREMEIKSCNEENRHLSKSFQIITCSNV